MSEFCSSPEKDPFIPKYELGDDELKYLSSELLHKYSNEFNISRRVVTIQVDGLSRFSNIGRQIERKVFEEKFGNNSKQMENEYGPYDKSSIFFISFDRLTGEPTGVLRVIKNSQNGLKTVNDIEDEPFCIDRHSTQSSCGIDDFNKVWDVGTVAVLKKHLDSDGTSSIQLFRAMYKSAQENDIDHLVSIIDNRAYKMLTGLLGIPFETINESSPMPYLGSRSSYAVHGYVPDFYNTMREYFDSSKSYIIKRLLDRLVNGSNDDSILTFESR